MFGPLKKKASTRKQLTENLLERNRVNINYSLPELEEEEDVSLRSPEEIARRVAVLSVLSLVAFSQNSGEEATEFLKKNELWDAVTPNERGFLSNPTEEKKSQETWKCEGIWTLMWALEAVEDLGDPGRMCNLDSIPPEKYPIGAHHPPSAFIASIERSRSKSEIMDAADLYYRLDWACVDARLNDKEVTGLNPGVVYERHYALNWLMRYQGQEWDDVSCDT